MTSQEPIRHEVLTWSDVDKIVDVLLPQITSAPAFDSMLMITRGGIIPGGLLAEALDIRKVLTAAVFFSDESDRVKYMALPRFLQFPHDDLLHDQRILIVDDVWGSGRTTTAVSGRVKAAGGEPSICVFHFNPYRSLFSKTEPDFYGAVTDAYIVYPWELDRGLRRIGLSQPKGDT
ncbi:MAG: phosphoribosyltransferase [Anaerolineae bacterium]|nr:phosphoribosyltransferase [Anaerolineae bacterium]